MGGLAGTQRVVECHIEGTLQQRVHDAWTQLPTQTETEGNGQLMS